MQSQLFSWWGSLLKCLEFLQPCCYQTENEAHTESKWREAKNWVLVGVPETLTQLAPELPSREALLQEIVHSCTGAVGCSRGFCYLWLEPPSE